MSPDPDNRVPQLDEFRENLRAMAAREIAAEQASRGLLRRFRRRHAVIGSICVVGLAGAAATASQLISTGEPVRPSFKFHSRYLPGEATPVVSVTAPDSALGPRWGVLVFDTANGQRCAKAGQLRGASVGLVENGVFRRFGPDVPGVCGRPTPGRLVYSIQRFATTPPRTLVYGRAGEGVARVRLTYPAGSARSVTGQGGAFVFVLDERQLPRPVVVTGLDAAGRTLP